MGGGEKSKRKRIKGGTVTKSRKIGWARHAKLMTRILHTEF
jgi:hypothetical protein